MFQALFLALFFSLAHFFSFFGFFFVRGVPEIREERAVIELDVGQKPVIRTQDAREMQPNERLLRVNQIFLYLKLDIFVPGIM